MAELNRKELERLGAQARLDQLQHEIAAIRRAFPGLGGGRRPAPAGDGAPVKRRRSRMSAAARKAVSVRMKKYWAARRKAKA